MLLKPIGLHQRFRMRVFRWMRSHRNTNFRPFRTAATRFAVIDACLVFSALPQKRREDAYALRSFRETERHVFCISREALWDCDASSHRFRLITAKSNQQDKQRRS